MTDPTPYGSAAPEPAPYSGAAAPASEKYNVLAIVSLVLAFFISLGAIITGHIALSQIKKTGEKGRGLALAGTIIGYVGLVLGIIFAIIYVAVIAAAVNSGYTAP